MFCSLIEPCGGFEDKFHDIKTDFPKFVWLSVAYRDMDVSLNIACVILQNTKLVVSVETVPRTIDVKHIQSNTLQLMILLKCVSYIVSFNDMFRL